MKPTTWQERLSKRREEKSSVTVLVPPVVCHNLDPHTGIPFMPHMAGHFAGALHEAGYDVQVIDCFGLQPNNRQRITEFMLMGADEKWVCEHLNPESKVAYIYCRTMAEFIAVERLVSAIHAARPDIKICLFENIQAVTSYSLRRVIQNFLDIGADAGIMGEPERQAEALTEALIANDKKALAALGGVAFYDEKKNFISTPLPAFDMQLDELPFPLWEKWPLEGYWIAGFAHAPKENHRFLPILTSRGCPYRCTFCVSPEINPKWRGRSANDVVNEMEYFYRTMAVHEFHISDLDPTVQDKRTQEICRELIRRDLPIIWKIAQGTKIETIKSEETLELMAKAGCRFLSFSPESGSPDMLKIMNKPFNHEHGLRMAKKAAALGIPMQSCFIAGVPGETEEHRQASIDYATKLIDVGVDEIAVFIFTPVPGAALAKAMDGYTHYSQCTPSPTWRPDWKVVHGYRYRMYWNYFRKKALQPQKIFRVAKGLLTGRYSNKMEMSLYKQVKLYALYYFPWFFKRLDATRYLAGLSEAETANLKAPHSGKMARVKHVLGIGYAVPKAQYS